MSSNATNSNERTVTERIVSVIAENQHLDAAKITPEATFAELGIDSFDGVNLLYAIETEFDINVSDDDAKALRGVQDVINGVDKLLAAKSEAAP